MMKNTLETQFNATAPVPNTAGASARRGRMQSRVILYAELDQMVHEYQNGQPVYKVKTDATGATVKDKYGQELYEKVVRADANPTDVENLAKMETFMAPIDAAPDDYDAIMDFGLPPITKLGQITERMMAIQQQFDAQVNVMKKAQEELEASGFKQFVGAGWELVKAGGGVVNKGMKGAAKGLLGWLNKDKKDPKSEEAAKMQEMINTLPQMMKQMKTLVNQYQGCENGIRQVIDQAAQLGQERLKAAAELSLYIACKDEVIKRYETIYIPEAQEAFDAEQSPQNKAYLEGVNKRRDQFNERIMSLAGSKMLCDQGAQEMTMAIQTMESQLTQIRTIVENSMPQWNSMLTSMGIAASSLKVADMIKSGNEFSDEIFTKSQEMLRGAHELTNKQSVHGVVDFEKLISEAVKWQEMIASSAAFQAENQRLIKERTDALMDANQRMIDEANKQLENRQIGDASGPVDTTAPSNPELAARARRYTPQGPATPSAPTPPVAE